MSAKILKLTRYREIGLKNFEVADYFKFCFRIILAIIQFTIQYTTKN